MTRIIDTIFSWFFNKKIFYGLFYHLYLIGLKGIEHGRNFGMITTSGELRVINVVERNFNKPIIIDGGANNGEYSLACSKIKDSRIFSFEPSAPTFSMLKEKVKGISNIEPFQLALSDESKKLLLRYDFEGSGIASVVECNFDHYGLHLDIEEVVNSTTIDSFCDKHAIHRINLLKLDIEGYEFTALKGATQMVSSGKVDLIQFEMGRPNVDSKIFFKDFFLHLHSDFTLYRILSFGLIPIPQYSYEYEIFMGSNYLAVRKESGIMLD